MGGFHQRQRFAFLFISGTACGGTDQQVWPHLTVVGAQPGGMRAARRHHAIQGHVAIVGAVVTQAVAIACREHINGTQPVAAFFQSCIDHAGQRHAAGQGVLVLAGVVTAPAVAVDVGVLHMALQRVQNVQIRSARHGIETAQLRPGRYTANAHAIVVACGNDAGHGRAMVLVLRARHGPRAAHGPVRQLGQIVVAAVGYHVLAQVFVRHLDAVVHHGNAYVFAPVPAVQRAQMQVFAGHRAGLAAVIVQVPLQMCQRIGAGQRGRCRFVFVAQRTFGRTQQLDGGGLAGVRVIAVRLMCAVRFRGNTVRAIRARATGCAGGVPGRGSASRRAAGRWAARAG